MKKPQYFLIALTFCAFTFAEAQTGETLSSAKQKYLNQRVVISSTSTSGMKLPSGEKVLDDDWYFVESGTKYKVDYEKRVPASVSGQTGIVEALALDGVAPQQKVNALGELVNPDLVVNQDIDLVVKLDDGHLIMKTVYRGNVSGFVELESEHERTVQGMSGKMNSILGKNLYAAGDSILWRPDTSLDYLEPENIFKQRIPIGDIPLLEPLQITGAKYVPTGSVIVLKLKLPNGNDVLAFVYARGLTIPDDDSSFLSGLARAGRFLPSIPSDFTSEEITAIKKRSVFRGMRKEALYCALGHPRAENDWGRGGRQFVYSDNLMIYLDNESKIVDWQSLNN